MKKIAIFTAVFAFILLLTKIANQVPADPAFRDSLCSEGAERGAVLA
jgi:hypothetical protein